MQETETLRESKQEAARRSRWQQARRRRREREAKIRKLKMAAAAVLVIVLAITLAVCMKSCRKEKEGAGEDRELVTDQELETGQETAPTVMAEPEQMKENAMEVYGCESLYGVYEYPWNTMSQDWSCEQVEGFFYHEISDKAKAAGGAFPVIAQVYTYIICRQYEVDYEIVFALIEYESSFRWDASGDGGTSIGLMQIAEKWHRERMERLNCTDLTNPYQNIRVGVDFLAELQTTLADSDFKMVDVLAAYNYGISGAKKYLWDNGIHWYTYNREIMARADELKQEKMDALAVRIEAGRSEEDAEERIERE